VRLPFDLPTYQYRRMRSFLPIKLNSMINILVFINRIDSKDGHGNGISLETEIVDWKNALRKRSPLRGTHSLAKESPLTFSQSGTSPLLMVQNPPTNWQLLSDVLHVDGEKKSSLLGSSPPLHHRSSSRRQSRSSRLSMSDL
jgi:hypothetical protein